MGMGGQRNSRPSSASSRQPLLSGKPRVDTGRSASASRRRDGSSAQHAEPWPAAGLCWEAIWLIAPLRETIHKALGQQKRGMSVASIGPLSRNGSAPSLAARPSGRDISKLGDSIATMMGVLSNLMLQLQGQEKSSSTPQAGGASPQQLMTATSSHATELEQQHLTAVNAARQEHLTQEHAKMQARAAALEACYTEEHLSQLEEEHAKMQARAAALEATAVETADLEQVVDQLRSRVAHLETRESRVTELRQECRTLRARVAELIGSTIDHNVLQDERSKLFEQVRELQQQESGSISTPLPATRGTDVGTAHDGMLPVQAA